MAARQWPQLLWALKFRASFDIFSTLKPMQTLGEFFVSLLVPAARRDRPTCAIPTAPLCSTHVPKHGRKAVVATLVCAEISMQFCFFCDALYNLGCLTISASESGLGDRPHGLRFKNIQSISWDGIALQSNLYHPRPRGSAGKMLICQASQSSWLFHYAPSR